jgi:hypothetical protein
MMSKQVREELADRRDFDRLMVVFGGKSVKNGTGGASKI